jgi:transcriptional regulator with AAA-type ATPase domain
MATNNQNKYLSEDLIKDMLKTFVNSGFSTLLIGERGTGKSKLVNEFFENIEKINPKIKKENCNAANCASFADDTMAESELFGYVKGAFTGAYNDKIGLIKASENGILFLDEVHHLSKKVQAKLMRAFQTNEKNEMYIRKLGASREVKVKDVRLIFASNKTIDELKKDYLLPDFFDRIAQQIIEIPPLRLKDPNERIKEWNKIWKQLKFGEENQSPSDNKFEEWLKKIPLYGNYRDLQIIAISYKNFINFNNDLKQKLNFTEAFDFVKEIYEKYHLEKFNNNNEFDNFKYYFKINKSYKEILNDFNYNLLEWATKTYGSKKEAANKLKIKSVKTLYNWEKEYKNQL